MFRAALFIGLAACFLHVVAIPVFWGLHSITLGDFEFPILPFLISFTITALLTLTFSFLDKKSAKGD